MYRQTFVTTEPQVTVIVTERCDTPYWCISPHFETLEGSKIKATRLEIRKGQSMLIFELESFEPKPDDGLYKYTYCYEVHGRQWYVNKYPTYQRFAEAIDSGLITNFTYIDQKLYDNYMLSIPLLPQVEVNIEVIKS